VVDLGDPDHEQHVSAVSSILGDLDLAEKPRLIAGNKSDRLGRSEAERRAYALGAVPVSALDRATLTPLLGAIEHELWKERGERAPDGSAAAAVEGVVVERLEA
jgi:GTP-binding protein HflX